MGSQSCSDGRCFLCLIGLLQKNYVHGVPVDKFQTGSDATRIAIVFRHGVERIVRKDSGVPGILEPRDVRVIYHHGCDMPGLEEGKLYPRTELIKLRAHRYVATTVCSAALSTKYSQLAFVVCLLFY